MQGHHEQSTLDTIIPHAVWPGICAAHSCSEDDARSLGEAITRGGCMIGCWILFDAFRCGTIFSKFLLPRKALGAMTEGSCVSRR